MMSDFLLNNYPVLISAFVAVFGAIVSIVSFFRKRRDCSLSSILESIPYFISEIESCLPVGCGELKLQYVLERIQKQCSLLHFSFDEEKFIKFIESVLSTPQKKK